MKQSNNQEKEKAPVADSEVEALQLQAVKLHLERDILGLMLEIRELRSALNGDSSTEETES